MNFHISNLSPLRPQFSSSSLGGPRRHQRDFHDSGRFVPVKIEVEHADPDDVEGDLYPGGKARSNGAHSRLDEVDDTDTDTDTPSDTSAEDDVTQDSRDVLVQRLTDLAERLGGARGVGAAGVEALHRHVDEMERELRRSSSRTRDGDRSASRRSSRRRRSSAALPRPRSLQLPSSSTLSSPGGGGDSFRGRESLGVMAAPMSPSWFMSQFQRRPSVHAREPEPVEETEAGAEDADGPDGREELASRQHSNSDSLVPQQQRQSREPADQSVVDETSSEHHAQPTSISSEVVEDVVKEAEKLCAEMATVIESLQTRREESDVIPSLSSLSSTTFPSVLSAAVLVNSSS